MNKDSRIYIAGHTGLLGSALIKQLKALRYIALITKPRSELDLGDAQQVNTFFNDYRPEYVFLAAGKTGGILANKSYPVQFLHENLKIQINAFEAAIKYKVKHLVFYGSSCMYPREGKQPMKEEYLGTGPVEETSQVYAYAKIAGVTACKVFNSQYKTNCFIALVPNSMYGPHDTFDAENAHVLSSLMRRIIEAKKEGKSGVTLWGSGNPRREFIFSEDVASASIFAIQNAHRLSHTYYNVGTGIDYSIRELAEEIAKTVGFQGKITWDTTKPDGAPRKLLDSSEFFKLGWKPMIELKEGIKKVYKWYSDMNT